MYVLVWFEKYGFIQVLILETFLVTVLVFTLQDSKNRLMRSSQTHFPPEIENPSGQFSNVTVIDNCAFDTSHDSSAEMMITSLSDVASSVYVSGLHPSSSGCEFPLKLCIVSSSRDSK